MAARDFAAGLRLDANAAAREVAREEAREAKPQPPSMARGVMDMGPTAQREQDHYVRIHKFNFTELAMRRLAQEKLHKEEGIERNNAAGVGSGHSKKLLAKKLIANGKKMH